jgi:hypothetical protein
MIRTFWNRRRRGGCGRHRLGVTGLTWCRDHLAVAAALAAPAIAGRGLFETCLSTARHAVTSYA